MEAIGFASSQRIYRFETESLRLVGTGLVQPGCRLTLKVGVNETRSHTTPFLMLSVHFVHRQQCHSERRYLRLVARASASQPNSHSLRPLRRLLRPTLSFAESCLRYSTG